jgi:hypothetical protein
VKYLGAGEPCSNDDCRDYCNSSNICDTYFDYSTADCEYGKYYYKDARSPVGKCEPNQKIGDDCSKDEDCGNFNLCNRRKCITPFQLNEGENCDNNAACLSGLVCDGTCVKQLSNPSRNECLISTHEGISFGSCKQPLLDLENCVYDNKCPPVMSLKPMVFESLTFPTFHTKSCLYKCKAQFDCVAKCYQDLIVATVGDIYTKYCLDTPIYQCKAAVTKRVFPTTSIVKFLFLLCLKGIISVSLVSK